MNSTQKIIKYFALAVAFFLIVIIFKSIYSFGFFVGNIIDNSNTVVEDGFTINNISRNIRNLNIELKASVLTIEYGDRFQVKTNNKNVKVTHENNKLNIIEKKYNVLNSNKNKSLVVVIPKTQEFDQVSIVNGAGTIDIAGLISKDLTIETGAGKTEVNNLNIKNKADIETGAGQTIINNSTIYNLDLDLGVGETTLNAILYGTNKIDSGIGELKLNLLNKKTNYQITTNNGIGTINIDGVKVKSDTTIGEGSNKIYLDGGIGTISVSFK